MALRLPVTKEILSRISINSPTIINKTNFDTPYKPAWVGFLRLVENGNFDLLDTSFKGPASHAIQHLILRVHPYATLRLR